VTDTASRRFGAEPQDIRATDDPEQLARAIVDHLFYTRGTLPEHATRHDWYLAVAHAVRDRLLDRWVATARTLMKLDVRIVSYFSAEFLVGPHLLEHDEYLALEDYEDYMACQGAVNAAYRDLSRWTRMSILNVARSRMFSSDRAIRQYCDEIWHAVPVRVEL
jgi:glucan phosphorylase